MSATAELDGLLNRLVDDQLDEPGAARLQDVLRGDAAARRRYRQVMAVHAGLQWDYVAAAREAQAPQRPRPRRSSRWWLPWSVALAASLLLAAVVARWPSSGPGPVMTASSVSNGSLTWSDGRQQHALASNDSVLPGTLLLEGDGAIAVLRFDDGTSMTLSGGTELAVDEQAGKRLDLRRGTLAAEVAHQPPGQPLTVTTATARLEVLGTVFTLGAGTGAGAQSTLTVEQGRVRLERLADHQAVEVAAGQQASVSFDAAKPIAVISRPQVPSVWSVDFAQRPPAHWSGSWTAPADGGVGWFASEPYVAGRDADGKPFIHHGVRVTAGQDANRPFVRLHADSRLTMRFRMLRGDARTQVKVMLCLVKDGGGFAGSFFASVDPQSLPADADGWRTAALAMPAFLPSRPTVHPSPIGNAVTFIIANTAARPAGLEVAALAIDQP